MLEHEQTKTPVRCKIRCRTVTPVQEGSRVFLEGKTDVPMQENTVVWLKKNEFSTEQLTSIWKDCDHVLGGTTVTGKGKVSNLIILHVSYNYVDVLWTNYENTWRFNNDELRCPYKDVYTSLTSLTTWLSPVLLQYKTVISSFWYTV